MCVDLDITYFLTITKLSQSGHLSKVSVIDAPVPFTLSVIVE